MSHRPHSPVAPSWLRLGAVLLVVGFVSLVSICVDVAPALGGAGGVYAFGWNDYGELGLGDTARRDTPTEITTLPGPAVALAAGDRHSLVLLQNGDVYAFGDNEYGELGLGDTIERLTPTKISTLPGPAIAIAAGDRHSLVLLQNGDVYAFGWSEYGQLGLGETTAGLVGLGTPTKITTLPGPAMAVAAGCAQSLVLLVNGDVHAFGDNEYGGLGLGDTTERLTPMKISTLPGPALAIATGCAHSLVLLQNGEVYAFGYNEYGELGLGDTTDRLAPAKIDALPGPATAVAAGCAHSLVLLASGDVYAFGWSGYGQLGLGDTTDRLTPVKIAALPGPATAVAAGCAHSLVLLANGDVYAFGYNEYGELGLGDTTERLTPTKITALPGPATAVAASGHSLVL